MKESLFYMEPEYKQKGVIFLDIDGVLNSGLAHEARSFEDGEEGFLHFDSGDYVQEYKLEMFKAWVEANDYLVVGVSSWFYAEDEETTQEHLTYNNTVADFLGIRDRFLGCTEYTGGGKGRGKAVLKYVEDNSIEKWGVLDDAKNMYSWEILDIHGRFGISGNDLIKLWRMMENK